MKQAHRWPKSIHSQIEAVFSSLRAIGSKKAGVGPLPVRGLGTWAVYRQDAHRFGAYLQQQGCHDLRDTQPLRLHLGAYLAERRSALLAAHGSFQTYEREIQALAKLSDAMQAYFTKHDIPFGADLRVVLAAEKHAGKETLAARSSTYSTRAYPDVPGLLAAIQSPTHRLQARLQAESGCRAEGVGAASRGRNPLTQDNLQGIVADPVTGQDVGSIEVREKGGKWTVHFMSASTYRQLQEHLREHGRLESSYRSYARAVEGAARLTAQYERGRGTHGLKHSFAQWRFAQGVRLGLSHEEAKQATALELAHNRLDVTDVYLR